MSHIQKIELLSYNTDNGVLITVLVKDENDVIKHKEECFNTQDLITVITQHLGDFEQ